MGAQKITTAGFLSEFLRRHELIPDRPFCWVLGSGASFQSGIPTGGALAKRWLEELHEMEDLDDQPIEKWATEKNLGIENFEFKNAAAFYPWIYWRRFRKFREEGYAFLEKVMEDIEPSYGYSVLAQIMANKQHKAAVTTNFDNLVADALAVYTRALPLVCGHESLTGFIRPNLQRPLVAKIHRDLLLNPKNEPRELEKLPAEWVVALTTIFSSYTPIVIGYGGNDGSLMGLLKSLPPIKGGIFWCYRIGDEPDVRIHEIIEHHDGSLVPILGFDELMLQLSEKLKISDPRPLLQKSHTERVNAWQNQFEALNKKIQERGGTKAVEAELKDVRAAAAATVQRLTKEKDWWAWQLKADAEKDPKKAEAVYREGLKDFPESYELTGNFALFMQNICEDNDEAERLHRKAIELGPKDPENLNGLAYFLTVKRKNFQEAESLARKAVELAPHNGNCVDTLAYILWKSGKDSDKANKLFKRALELEPENDEIQKNYANFLKAHSEFAK